MLFRYDGDFFVRNLQDSVERSKKREKGLQYYTVLHMGSCASGEFYFIGIILADFMSMFHYKRAVKRYLVLSRCRRKKSYRSCSSTSLTKRI